MRDHYLKKWYIRVATWVAKLLKTSDLRKLGNIRKVPKPHRMIAQRPGPLPNWTFCSSSLKLMNLNQNYPTKDRLQKTGFSGHILEKLPEFHYTIELANIFRIITIALIWTMSFLRKIIETKLILGLHIQSSVVKFTCKIFAIHDCNSDNNNKKMKNTKTIGNQVVRKYLGTSFTCLFNNGFSYVMHIVSLCFKYKKRWQSRWVSKHSVWHKSLQFLLVLRRLKYETLSQFLGALWSLLLSGELFHQYNWRYSQDT